MENLVQYVNPNIGTIGHLLATTKPNIQSPHGGLVLTPYFRPGVKDIYNSDAIFGFCCGSARVMPVNSITATNKLFCQMSGFDHDLEKISPNEYQVLLEDNNITVKMTAMKHYGILSASGENLSSLVLTVNGHLDDVLTISDDIFVVKSPNGENTYLYTAYSLSQKGEFNVVKGQAPNSYKPENLDACTAIQISGLSKEITLKMSQSYVCAESAVNALKNDVLNKSFEQVSKECFDEWNNLLSKVQIESDNEDKKTIFYTAIYRAASRMHNYSVNGEYFGYDHKPHKDDKNDFYCDDGIWDTYRGMHPLQAILEPKIHEDILASYLRMYKESGWLPRFPYPAGNIPCMLGHHSISLFADALAKDIPFDLSLAYEAGYKNATKRTMCPWKDGEAEELTKCYYEKGFFPGLEEDEEETCENVHSFENRQSVAVTMEHSYDDWCMAKLAEAMDMAEDKEYFQKRAKNYLNVYNDKTGFVHPRKIDGSLTEKYDPKFCGGQGGRKYFAENNAYIYNFHIQHDIEGMINMHGGKENFSKKLDNLYIEQYDGVLKSTFLMQYPDATGLMGQFCMGNEPSFHIPYLYNYCGEAYKTQRKIHEIVDLWFTNSPLGICGDEDGGAMSAWLVFSAMGFYPVTPGTDRYDIGSPIFENVRLTLPNGKALKVIAKGVEDKACRKKYIQAAALNGKPLDRPYFTHKEMLEGGTLELIMSERPNKELWK